MRKRTLPVKFGWSSSSVRMCMQSAEETATYPSSSKLKVESMEAFYENNPNVTKYAGQCQKLGILNSHYNVYYRIQLNELSVTEIIGLVNRLRQRSTIAMNDNIKYIIFYMINLQKTYIVWMIVFFYRNICDLQCFKRFWFSVSVVPCCL